MKMKYFATIQKSIFMTLSVVLLSAAQYVIGGPVDLSPPKNAVGSADENGFLRLVQPLGEIELAHGEKIPLRLDFSSSRLKTNSAFGWTGWNCGALEARAEFFGGIQFIKVRLLCAKELFLKRDSSKSNTYTSMDGAWNGVAAAGVITVSRADGWKLVFEKNLITELQTDQGNLYVWNRDGEGRLTALTEKGSEAALVNLTWSKDGALQKIKTISDEYEIETSAGFLKNVNWDVGSVKPNRLNLEQSNESLKILRGFQPAQEYLWNAESGELKTDGGNSYRVEKSKGGKEGRMIVKTVVMDRSDGKTLKVQLDSGKGMTRKTVSALNGDLVVRRITRQGPGNNSVIRVDWMAEGAEKPVILLRNHFDDRGRVIKREWLGNPRVHAGYAAGRVESVFFPAPQMEYPEDQIEAAITSSGKGEMSLFTYKFDRQGRHITTQLDGENVLMRKYQGSRLLSFQVPGRFTWDYLHKDDGTSERVISVAEPTVQESLTPANFLSPRTFSTASTRNAKGQLVSEKYRDGRTERYQYDQQNRLRGTEVIAPDGKSIVSEQEFYYSPDNSRRFEKTINHLTKRELRFEAVLNNDGIVVSRYEIFEDPQWIAEKNLINEAQSKEDV